MITFASPLNAFYKHSSTSVATQIAKPVAIVVTALLLFAVFSAPAQAQNQGRWYKVEMLIFKRLNQAQYNSENWRNDLSLQYPDKYQYLPNTLPSNSHRLGGMSYSLGKSENYRVLFHKSWKQQMWGRNRSAALIIRGGKELGNHRELEGSIKIHIGRYLYLGTDLWLSDIGNSASGNWPRIPALPNNNSSSNSFLSELTSQRRVTVMREKRRMRSKEVHYIDHPLMGIVVYLTPL